MENHRHLSWWEHKVFFENIDVAIVGGGIVGINAAIRLREADAGLRVVIFERGSLPAGASTRNAGFACFGSMTELLNDLEHQSEEEVFSLVEMRWKGLQKLKERVGESAMEYAEYGGYELFRKEETIAYQSCTDQLSHFNKRMAAITGKSDIYSLADDQLPAFGFSGRVTHLIKNKAEGQLNPAKMMERLYSIALEKGIRIFNGISITAVDSGATGAALQTSQGWTIPAQKVLLANNGFVRSLLPALEVQPARNQVMVSPAIPGLKFRGCFHYDRGYYYFRNLGDRILLGGGRNLSPEEETTTDFGAHPVIRAALTRFLNEIILPGQAVEPAFWWSGILGIGQDKRPILREVERNVYVAVRLGGMGIAIGSLIGEKAAEMLLDK